MFAMLVVWFRSAVLLISGSLLFFGGGGVEPESNYPQWKRMNQNIERFASLNDSINKLTEGD